MGMAMLLITHDLGIVRRMADRVYVMRNGEVVEQGGTETIFEEPKHPYTRALLSAVPVPEPGRTKSRIMLKGEIPSPIDPPSGCKFHPRCPDVMDVCKQEVPRLVQLGDTKVACHLYP
jgi:oligopeptide/dipeptide ABC transporter ATP-binding protein